MVDGFGQGWAAHQLVLFWGGFSSQKGDRHAIAILEYIYRYIYINYWRNDPAHHLIYLSVIFFFPKKGVCFL